MSQPPPYDPQHAFVSDSATLANFPGQQLDVEFNALAAVTDAIEANLKLIQRDDGALANGVVTYDSLSASVQTNGITGALAWVTGIPYVVGAPVVQSSKLYRCQIAHTSGVFATDLAAGDWIFVVNIGVAGPASSTAGNVPKFHDTTGLLLDDSGIAIAALALLASPTFTGTPAAPTAAVDTNTTQLATAAFVLAQAATSSPLADSASAVGTSTRFARADHVHPFPAMTGDVTSVQGAVAITIAANAVTNAKLAAMAAWTLKVNATSGSATPTDITIDGLTLKGSPASTDEVLLWDVAGSALKKATVSGIGTASGVASIDSATGAFTTGNGIQTATGVIQLTPARRTLPTIQTFTSGTAATYTTPAGCLWIEVFAVGGGGGGAGAASGTSTVAGTAGNSTTFNSIVAAGGGAGPGLASTGFSGGGTGGTGGTGSATRRYPGSPGGEGSSSTATVKASGFGGASGLNGGGGAGVGATPSAGNAGVVNSGGGGSGAINNSGTNNDNGSGGGGGEAFYLIINNPSATYTYTVGPTAAGGVSTSNGGAGAAGFIQVIEHYGS